ncbi:LysR family transcriptional regulator [Deminuibacter soli]|uniref:LysR family transcriptional regulator n=1 Tax=Deminuibacter soli TaxID=2291815 RepID=A0A3E1NEI7_9BACT|nr:LysR family transcriptional regulator [Deminuibacter soli]RFM26390.1 LysR family transcriptional regulator [Deminuibacter soli]
MVNLEWFRTFKAIYETGTLTGAADTLYVSQPGVSLHLSSLETYVGYKLFDRTARKMVATEKGKMLYNYISESLLKMEEAERIFHKSTEAGKPTISIGLCFETFQFTLESYLPTLPFNVIIKFGEYPEMLADLDNGILDLVITPQKSEHKNIQYKAFSKEKIVLVAGAKTPVTEFNKLSKKNDLEGMQAWLKQQTWYGTAGDMEHLIRFWYMNFGKRPDFKPNYIVPNMCSIVRCISKGKGIAIIPDFLFKHELESGDIRVLWEGINIMENTLHFAMRKKTMYAAQIERIQEIFEQEML